MNLFYFTGYLGSDPEAKYLPSGTMLCNFRVAVSERWTDKTTGEIKEKTLWINVTAWAGLAETCAKHLAKGARVGIRGRVDSVRGYLTRDGEPGASLDVRADELEFLSPRPEGEHRPPTQSDRPVGPNNPTGNPATKIRDEDIPF